MIRSSLKCSSSESKMVEDREARNLGYLPYCVSCLYQKFYLVILVANVLPQFTPACSTLLEGLPSTSNGNDTAPMFNITAAGGIPTHTGIQGDSRSVSQISSKSSSLYQSISTLQIINPSSSQHSKENNTAVFNSLTLSANSDSRPSVWLTSTQYSSQLSRSISQLSSSEAQSAETSTKVTPSQTIPSAAHSTFSQAILFSSWSVPLSTSEQLNSLSTSEVLPSVVKSKETVSYTSKTNVSVPASKEGPTWNLTTYGSESSYFFPSVSVQTNVSEETIVYTVPASESKQSSSSRAINSSQHVQSSGKTFLPSVLTSTMHATETVVASSLPQSNYSSTHIQASSTPTILTSWKEASKSTISRSSSKPNSPWVTYSKYLPPSSTTNPPTIAPSHLVCDQLLFELSDAMNNMTGCLMQYMHPLQVCEKCHEKYEVLQQYHRYIFAQESCGEKLVGNFNEQYQLIPKLYDFSKHIWDSFDCSKCAKTDPDDPFNWTPKNEFIQFKLHLADTMNCIYNYSTVVLPYPVSLANRSDIGNQTGLACTKCNVLYSNLQRYFSTMLVGQDHGSQWCADIIYAVNETRKIWGQVLHCDVVKRDLESVVALTCFFCFMPIIFYVGTKLHSDVKERKHGSRLGYESD